MSPRIAIIGSCVTRDLWPLAEAAPRALLYVSRTSLPSLAAPRPCGVQTEVEPPPALKRHQHNALKADLEKTALEALIAFRPTHLIFDFIDERFDLLQAGSSVITRSWELIASPYLRAWSEDHWSRIPRLGSGCERLWRDALAGLAPLILQGPLRDATVILHASRWAESFLDTEGAMQDFPDMVDILPGESAPIQAHNGLLARYEAAFLDAFPGAARVSSRHRTADAAHRWGLSPFHYIDAYYDDIRSQLADLGASAV